METPNWVTPNNDIKPVSRLRPLALLLRTLIDRKHPSRTAKLRSIRWFQNLSSMVSWPSTRIWTFESGGRLSLYQPIGIFFHRTKIFIELWKAPITYRDPRHAPGRPEDNTSA